MIAIATQTAPKLAATGESAQQPEARRAEPPAPRARRPLRHWRLPSPGGAASRWVTLFVLARTGAVIVAAVLLLINDFAGAELWLAAVVLAWGALSMAAVLRFPALQRSWPAWVFDVAAALALVAIGGNWRSPFYLLGLSALILPATSLRAPAALLAGLVYSTAYFGIAVLTGLQLRAFGSAASEPLGNVAPLETLATHLMVPLLIVLALAYASELLDRLGSERERAARLAIEAERKRIAWDLHDSAKQRVHAAHLLLSALMPGLRGEPAAAAGQALEELSSAAAEMDTNVSELQSPLDGRPLGHVVRERAQQLEVLAPGAIAVRGEAPPLPALVVAHAARIAVEALTNAVRHSQATRIDVDMAQRGRRVVVMIADDGCGMPETIRPGASGLRSMRSRAATIGATLEVGAADGGRGTLVRLELPLDHSEEHPS